MATRTETLGLIKPAYDDAADIAVINANSDTLDTTIAGLQKCPILAWVANTAYAVGDIVVYDKKIYQCITANSDAEFTKAKWDNIGGGGGLPIGTIVPYSSNGNYPDGYLLCDGASVGRTMYPDLFAVIGTTYGAIDDEHFSLPNLTDKFIEGSATAGTEKSAGLPNITGTVGTNLQTLSTATSSGVELGEGAISAVTNKKVCSDNRNQDSYCVEFSFDASKSNSIYGNSDTVQPPAITMRYIIKAFDGQTADSTLIDVTQYANELATKVSRAEADYVTETYTDDDGNWYRVYKSGWVEQGGKGALNDGNNENVVISLLKSMQNAYYQTNIMTEYISSTAGGYVHNSFVSKTSTNFTVFFTCTHSTMTIGTGYTWSVCGQGAE